MELNEAYQKALVWFFSFPNRGITLNDLSRELKLAKTTTNHVVNRLKKEGFLKVESLGRVWRISCNKEHHYNYTKKIAYNLMMIYDSGILERISQLVKNSRVVILFGSYRKGDDDKNSDIDIAVEVLGDKDIKIIELGFVPQIGFRKNVPVNLHLFTRKSIDLNLFSNIANGIILDGFLEVNP